MLSNKTSARPRQPQSEMPLNLETLHSRTFCKRDWEHSTNTSEIKALFKQFNTFINKRILNRCLSRPGLLRRPRCCWCRHLCTLDCPSTSSVFLLSFNFAPLGSWCILCPLVSEVLVWFLDALWRSDWKQMIVDSNRWMLEEVYCQVLSELLRRLESKRSTYYCSYTSLLRTFQSRHPYFHQLDKESKSN